MASPVCRIMRSISQDLLSLIATVLVHDDLSRLARCCRTFRSRFSMPLITWSRLATRTTDNQTKSQQQQQQQQLHSALAAVSTVSTLNRMSLSSSGAGALALGALQELHLTGRHAAPSYDQQMALFANLCRVRVVRIYGACRLSQATLRVLTETAQRTLTELVVGFPESTNHVDRRWQQSDKSDGMYKLGWLFIAPTLRALQKCQNLHTLELVRFDSGCNVELLTPGELRPWPHLRSLAFVPCKQSANAMCDPRAQLQHVLRATPALERLAVSECAYGGPLEMPETLNELWIDAFWGVGWQPVDYGRLPRLKMLHSDYAAAGDFEQSAMSSLTQLHLDKQQWPAESMRGCLQRLHSFSIRTFPIEDMDSDYSAYAFLKDCPLLETICVECKTRDAAPLISHLAQCEPPTIMCPAVPMAPTAPMVCKRLTSACFRFYAEETPDSLFLTALQQLRRARPQLRVQVQQRRQFGAPFCYWRSNAFDSSYVDSVK